MIRTLSFTAAIAAILTTGCASDGKAFRSAAELAPRTLAPPTVTVAGRITRDTDVRSSPHELSPVLVRLPSGTEVLVSEQASRGWRRVKTPDGKGGYVLDSAIEIATASAPATTPAIEAAPATPPDEPQPVTATP
jgi:uncharacterized protein YgiM (DUF1202 family)